MTTLSRESNSAVVAPAPAPGLRLLVAIPCFNEEKTIADVVSRIPRQLDGVAEVDVLVIDDGCTDATAARAQGAGAKVLRHGRNRGLGHAFRSAVQYTLRNNFDAMVNIDGDGQFDPADISKLIAPIAGGQAEFVTASRFMDPSGYPDMPRIKFWGNRRMSELISLLARQKFFDVSCGFRAYSQEALLTLNLQGRFTHTQETFLNLCFHGLSVVEVPVEVKYFPDRKSRVAGSLWRYATRSFSIILRSYRDYHPLRFFWYIALFAFLVGSGFAAVLLTHYFKTGQFTGQIWAGFVGASFYAVSVIFFVLGIVTDMLASVRLNQESILFLLKDLGRRSR